MPNCPSSVLPSSHNPSVGGASIISFNIFNVNFLFKKLHSDTNNNFSIQNFDQNKSRSVADFISGMTDRYAINLYEELK